MRKLMPLIIMLIIALSPLLAQEYDLARPETYLDAFTRVRGDAKGGETVYFWTGSIYSIVPGERRRELFGFEVFNIARTLPGEAGFKLLSREAAFFTDYQSGQILEKWRNPFTNTEVPVIHIWNDPVNQDMDFGMEMLPYIHKMLPGTDLGEEFAFHMDIFPFYDSPLPRKDFPEYSQSDIYQSAEFFQFFANKSDLADSTLSSVPVDITWNRISPWMPFMKMGDRAGQLVFVCRGQKLEGGFEALPPKIKDYVKLNHPEFAFAPSEWTEPNATSWTYFRKLYEQGLIEPLAPGGEE